MEGPIDDPPPPYYEKPNEPPSDPSNELRKTLSPGASVRCDMDRSIFSHWIKFSKLPVNHVNVPSHAMLSLR